MFEPWHSLSETDEDARKRTQEWEQPDDPSPCAEWAMKGCLLLALAAVLAYAGALFLTWVAANAGGKSHF